MKKRCIPGVVIGALCVLVTMGTGCGPSQEDLMARKVVAEVKAREAAEADAKAVIAAQFDKGIKAIVTDDFAGFKALLDPTSRQDGGKCGLVWAGLRFMVGAGGLKDGDFRIDTVAFNKEMTLAMATTSHREKGEWKQDVRPQIWIQENGGWRYML